MPIDGWFDTPPISERGSESDLTPEKLAELARDGFVEVSPQEARLISCRNDTRVFRKRKPPDLTSAR